MPLASKSSHIIGLKLGSLLKEVGRPRCSQSDLEVYATASATTILAISYSSLASSCVHEEHHEDADGRVQPRRA